MNIFTISQLWQRAPITKDYDSKPFRFTLRYWIIYLLSMVIAIVLNVYHESLDTILGTNFYYIVLAIPVIVFLGLTVFILRALLDYFGSKKQSNKK